MASEKGRPLPKFGEWDVNNPASADGFTVIFAKARDEKNSGSTATNGGQPPLTAGTTSQQSYDPPKKSWLCCF